MGFFDSLKGAVNDLGDKMVETNDNAVEEWVGKYRHLSEYELKRIANSDTGEGNYKAWQIQAARYILVKEQNQGKNFDTKSGRDYLITKKYSIR